MRQLLKLKGMLVALALNASKDFHSLWRSCLQGCKPLLRIARLPDLAFVAAFDDVNEHTYPLLNPASYPLHAKPLRVASARKAGSTPYPHALVAQE